MGLGGGPPYFNQYVQLWIITKYKGGECTEIKEICPIWQGVVHKIRDPLGGGGEGTHSYVACHALSDWRRGELASAM